MNNPKVKIDMTSLGSSKVIAVMLLIAMALTMWAWKAPAQEAQAKVEPTVLERAAQSPDETFQVIVQKLGASTAPEEAVNRLGGQVLRHLNIINSFSAELKGSALPDLARTPGVRWLTIDSPVVETNCGSCVDMTNLVNVYNSTIRADRVWNAAPYLQGQGVTVAVLDSGVHQHTDLMQQLGTGANRMRASVRNNGLTNLTDDNYGHGSHIAGVVGGNGKVSGEYIGVAPRVDFVSVKVADDSGRATTSDVVAGIEWINNNKDQYNIRVVNVSMNAGEAQNYRVSPLNAALEILWFNGVVVVVSAGNNGGTNSIMYPPANDPFFITVGATDDKGTLSTADDTLASFSARGVTESGFVKPDLVAPGTNIVSTYGKHNNYLARTYLNNRVRDSRTNGFNYFRMSGTSTAAPMVAGAAALLLQDEPNLTPDQVKFRLRATARPFNGGVGHGTQAPHLDVYAAVVGTTTASSNTGLMASELLFSGSQPVAWGSVNWNSVNWNSVNWNSVNWNSVNWNSVNWNSDHFQP